MAWGPGIRRIRDVDKSSCPRRRNALYYLSVVQLSVLPSHYTMIKGDVCRSAVNVWDQIHHAYVLFLFFFFPSSSCPSLTIILFAWQNEHLTSFFNILLGIYIAELEGSGDA